ncbi:MAG: hypothetical protein ACOYOK_14065, partial [Pseudobdellovibrionaceae bacterium]
MSAKKWFVLEQTIEGPLSIEDLEFLLTQKPHLQIWGKGMTEWLPLDKWRQFVETQADYKAQLREESSALGLSWKIRVEGQEKDPMTFHQMINELRKKTDYSV